MTSAAIPPHFVLGGASYRALAKDDARCSRIVSQLLAGGGGATVSPTVAPPPAAGRTRLTTAHGAAPPHALQLRQRGFPFVTRERREREATARLVEAHGRAVAQIGEAESQLVETQRQLDEGLIQPDGTPVGASKARKRKSDASGADKPALDPAAALLAGVAGAGVKRKAPADGAMVATTPDGEPVEVKKPRGRPPGSKNRPPEEREREKWEKLHASAEAKLSKKAAKRPASVGGGGGLYEPGAIVEVCLRLGEAFANWYEGRLVEQSKSTKWKIQLCRKGDDGEYEPLWLQGRGEYESATPQNLRPLPQPEPDWSPTVGEFCELLFEDGWWKVRVQEAAAAGEWTVIYAPAQAVHTVGRERLRPIYTWDSNKNEYAPLKAVGRGAGAARSGRESA